MQSLADLLKTLLDLSGEHTTIVMSYEERTTGNKPLIEKKFFEVSVFVSVKFCVLDAVRKELIFHKHACDTLTKADH